MFATVARLNVPYIAMHMRGNPMNMSQYTDYENLIKEIADFFHQKVSALHEHGVKDVILDPGFGFSKTVQQNFELLNRLDYFKNSRQARHGWIIAQINDLEDAGDKS